LYLLPILIFSKPNSKTHKIAFNFLVVTMFICSIAFAIGADTPDILDNSPTTPRFYMYHSYVWHMLLVILFVYLVVFRFEGAMYSKINLQVSIFIFIFNLVIFFYSEILVAANIDGSQWIIYNHDIEPIFGWCNQNPYLTNFVIFILIVVLYTGVYFAYFYIERTIRRKWYKKHNLKINF
jgi:hypothetical protein